MVLMHRWSPDSPIPIHISDGPLISFMLVSDKKPPHASSSEGISVSVEHRPTDWLLVFSLENRRFAPVFQSLYEDMCYSIIDADPVEAGEIMIDVYNKWKSAFSKKSNKLSSKEVQGLIGEMVVIRDVLMSDYDPRTVLNGWMLEEYGKQDFIFNNAWVEVKTIHVGVESIHISSIEQLDCAECNGSLIVVKIKRTSTNDKTAVTLDRIIGELYDLFSKGGCGSEFMSLMSDFGLPSEEYDKYAYNIVSKEIYDVNDTFPHIRRSELDPAIGRVEYDLSLHSLIGYLR